MTTSRFIGILSAAATGATVAGVYLTEAKPDWAFWLLGVAAVVNAVTPRIQGDGFKLSDDECEIIQIHREKERQRERERNA